ncbi:lipoprotein [Streptomyces spororaveus]|uniref:lipoprotein n=1 Tax=Streptomyces spororaveus TaxID=284039 RepID=UPI001924688E|nr:lipoprotein [Streptomyces spororaveus]
MRSATGAIGTGVLAAGLMACGPSESKQTPAGRGVQDPKPAASASASASAGTGTAAGVKAVGSVGGEDTPCRLPVSFDLVQDWKPKAVTHAEDDRFASLFQQGGMTLACEIDAKPAGNIGFLRVWVADEPAAPGDARKVLEAFMAGEKAKGTPVYTDLKAGPAGAALPAVQAAYETDPLDEPKKESAFAAVTPGGEAVVVQLGGLDSGEHDEMLPAFRLAQQSLKAANQR